jgi:type VI secretion system protein
MPRERSLTERLRDPEAGRAPTLRENTQRLADSVQANLQRVLNSRHGVTPIREDYGIPDISDMVHLFPDATAELRNGIKSAIEKFEPRLRRVNVKHAPDPDDPLSMRFEITAELVTDGDKAGVWFETRVNGDGGVSVKG